MKIKIGIYLEEDVARRFKVAARRPAATKSAIVNEALRRFLDPAPESGPSDEVLRRLGQLAKRLRRVHRETQVMGEALGPLCALRADGHPASSGK